MELRHLRVFVTLAEELHFGRTALRLHLTQPAVSGQLRQLEDALGVQLIRRTARQVSLTDVGVGFLRDARRVLEQADAATGGVRRFRDGLRASLRVGYLSDAIPPRLPVSLRRTAHDFPGTRVLLSTGEPQKLLDDLRDDLLDVAVISLPAPVSGLRVLPVGFERDADTNWQTRLAQYDAVCTWGQPNHSLLQRVSAIDKPVFVANGDSDPMILPRYSYLLAGLIGGARLKLYADSAHGFLFQHHAEFVADVDGFLDGA